MLKSKHFVSAFEQSERHQLSAIPTRDPHQCFPRSQAFRFELVAWQCAPIQSINS
jgi:hypothetical protein